MYLCRIVDIQSRFEPHSKQVQTVFKPNGSVPYYNIDGG
jgi:hypothetical protein